MHHHPYCTSTTYPVMDPDATQRLLRVFLPNPENFIAGVESAVVRAKGYSQYLCDTVQRVETLLATDYRLKHALRVAVRQLNRMALKVLEYIDSAEGLSRIAHKRKEMICQEIDRCNEKEKDVLSLDALKKSPCFAVMEDFIEEMKSRIKSMDNIHGDIVNLYDQFVVESDAAFDRAEQKENEANTWKSNLKAVTLTAAVTAATGGLLITAFGAAPTAARAMASAATTGAGIVVSSGACRMSKEISHRQTDFRQSMKEIDVLRRDSNTLHRITDEVEVTHAEFVKTETKFCTLDTFPEVLDMLCKRMRSVDFESVTKEVESIRTNLRTAIKN